jgi:hypothetical protein
MKSITIFILAIMAVAVGSGSAAAAQKVVLVTGDIMTVDHARVEDDRVWISWSGMTLSIDKKDVLHIESGGKRHLIVHDTSVKSQSQKQQPARKGPKQAQKALPPDRSVNGQTNNDAKSTADAARQRSTSKSARPVKSPPPGRLTESAESFLAFLTPEGFSDLKWGDEPDPRAGFRRLEEDSELPEVYEYFRRKDPVQLGRDDDNRIVKYAFWRNRLYMVTLWAAGTEAYAAMREAMVKRYGPGIQSPEKKLACYWVDETADRMIDYLEDRNLGMLWMRSREINHRYKLSRLRIPINASQSARSKSSEGQPQTKN